MQRAALSVALLAATAASAAAQEVRGVVIVEHGIYMAEVTGTERLPNGVELDTLASICHVATTTTIPAIRGLTFGLRYRIDGPAPVALRKVVVFPTLMRPPGAPQPLTSYELPITWPAGGIAFTGYSFDHSWEFETGTWTFQILQGDRRLAAMSFQVVDGTGASVPRSRDGDCFQMSSL